MLNSSGGKLVTTRETSNRSRFDLQILQAHSLPSCGDQWHYSRSDRPRPSSDCPPDLQIQRWNKSALAVCLFDSQPTSDKGQRWCPRPDDIGCKERRRRGGRGAFSLSLSPRPPIPSDIVAKFLMLHRRPPPRPPHTSSL